MGTDAPETLGHDVQTAGGHLCGGANPVARPPPRALVSRRPPHRGEWITVEAATPAVPPTVLPEGSAPGDKGLKTGALGFASSVVIGVASTAPGYSLASVLGLVVAVAGIGVYAPGILIAAFIPMLLVAVGYRELTLVRNLIANGCLATTRHHEFTVGHCDDTVKRRNQWERLILIACQHIASNYVGTRADTNSLTVEFAG